MPLARKLAPVLHLSCGELARLADLQRNTLRIKAGAVFIEEGQARPSGLHPAVGMGLQL